MRRRKPREPEARLRWERGVEWTAAIDATREIDDERRRLPWLALYLVVLTITAVVATLTSCTKKNGPEPDPDAPPVPTPNVEAGVESGEACARMCANLDRLGCVGKSGRRLADPTPGGTSCVESCEKIETADGVSLNPSCQAAAETCEAADRCDD